MTVSFTSLNKIMLILATTILQLLGAILQCDLTDMVSGQAMAIPSILTGTLVGVVLVIYSIAFLFDYKLKRNGLRVFSLLLQMAVILFTVKRFIFYRGFTEGEMTSIVNDQYPPGDEIFMMIVFFSIIIFAYNFFKLLSDGKWQY